LEAHKQEIVSGELVVFFLDECHLLWGDVCGYIWGKTEQRIEVPVANERQKQTYFGALNFSTQEFCLKAYEKGNSESTVAFVQYLRTQSSERRIVLIWDGASYHRSQQLRDYLESANQGLDESRWKITCIRFAPHAPQQNPVEDIWLYAKRFIREFYHLCQSFSALKRLFELVTHHQTFSFPKVFTYGLFS